MNKLWYKFKHSSFVNHISFLWHWKNFFFCLKYSFWKARNVWDNKFAGYAFTWYDDISLGWRIAFGKQLSDEIKQAGKASRKRLKKHLRWKDMLQWQQIKEKYGELCIYASTTEEIDKVIRKYELMSICYCEYCGKPARYITDGWITYLCEDCFVSLWKDEIIETKKSECRLTKKDIPVYTIYEKDKKRVVNLKEEYNIDFEKCWALKEGDN